MSMPKVVCSECKVAQVEGDYPKHDSFCSYTVTRLIEKLAGEEIPNQADLKELVRLGHLRGQHNRGDL